MSSTMRDLIPAINVLKSASLQEAVSNTWMQSLETSPWDSLDDVPSARHTPNRSLLRHVNEVNDWAQGLFEFAVSRFGLEPDWDTAIAAAILHDVDKPLLNRRAGDAFEYAEGKKQADHGPVGAALAIENGVPEAIAALVRDHSPFSKNGLPGTAEGTILHYADLTAADFAHVEYGTEPVHERVKMVLKENL